MWKHLVTKFQLESQKQMRFRCLPISLPRHRANPFERRFGWDLALQRDKLFPL